MSIKPFEGRPLFNPHEEEKKEERPEIPAETTRQEPADNSRRVYQTIEKAFDESALTLTRKSVPNIFRKLDQEVIKENVVIPRKSRPTRHGEREIHFDTPIKEFNPPSIKYTAHELLTFLIQKFDFKFELYLKGSFVRDLISDDDIILANDLDFNIKIHSASPEATLFSIRKFIGAFFLSKINETLSDNHSLKENRTNLEAAFSAYTTGSAFINRPIYNPNSLFFLTFLEGIDISFIVDSDRSFLFYTDELKVNILEYIKKKSKNIVISSEFKLGDAVFSIAARFIDTADSEKLTGPRPLLEMGRQLTRGYAIYKDEMYRNFLHQFSRTYKKETVQKYLEDRFHTSEGKILFLSNLITLSGELPDLSAFLTQEIGRVLEWDKSCDNLSLAFNIWTLYTMLSNDTNPFVSAHPQSDWKRPIQVGKQYLLPMRDPQRILQETLKDLQSLSAGQRSTVFEIVNKLNTTVGRPPEIGIHSFDEKKVLEYLQHLKISPDVSHEALLAIFQMLYFIDENGNLQEKEQRIYQLSRNCKYRHGVISLDKKFTKVWSEELFNQLKKSPLDTWQKLMGDIIDVKFHKKQFVKIQQMQEPVYDKTAYELALYGIKIFSISDFEPEHLFDLLPINKEHQLTDNQIETIFRQAKLCLIARGEETAVNILEDCLKSKCLVTSMLKFANDERAVNNILSYIQRKEKVLPHKVGSWYIQARTKLLELKIQKLPEQIQNYIDALPPKNKVEYTLELANQKGLSKDELLEQIAGVEFSLINQEVLSSLWKQIKATKSDPKTLRKLYHALENRPKLTDKQKQTLKISHQNEEAAKALTAADVPRYLEELELKGSVEGIEDQAGFIQEFKKVIPLILKKEDYKPSFLLLLIKNIHRIDPKEQTDIEEYLIKIVKKLKASSKVNFVLNACKQQQNYELTKFFDIIFSDTLSHQNLTELLRVAKSNLNHSISLSSHIMEHLEPNGKAVEIYFASIQTLLNHAKSHMKNMDLLNIMGQWIEKLSTFIVNEDDKAEFQVFSRVYQNLIHFKRVMHANTEQTKEKALELEQNLIVQCRMRDKKGTRTMIIPWLTESQYHERLDLFMRDIIEFKNEAGFKQLIFCMVKLDFLNDKKYSEIITQLREYQLLEKFHPILCETANHCIEESDLNLVRTLGLVKIFKGLFLQSIQEGTVPSVVDSFIRPIFCKLNNITISSNTIIKSLINSNSPKAFNAALQILLLRKLDELITQKDKETILFSLKQNIKRISKVPGAGVSHIHIFLIQNVAKRHGIINPDKFEQFSETTLNAERIEKLLKNKRVDKEEKVILQLFQAVRNYNKKPSNKVYKKQIQQVHKLACKIAAHSPESKESESEHVVLNHMLSTFPQVHPVSQEIKQIMRRKLTAKDSSKYLPTFCELLKIQGD